MGEAGYPQQAGTLIHSRQDSLAAGQGHVPPFAGSFGVDAGMEILPERGIHRVTTDSLVVVVGEEVSEFIDSFGTCTRTAKFLQPDVCTGSCTGGRVCVISTFQTYGPAFMGMVEPTACSC